MKNKNLLIGAGVVLVGYLLWKKSKDNSINKSAIVVPKNALVKPHLGMPQVKISTPEEQKALHDILVKMLPNEFVIKLDSEHNINYAKGLDNEFYKTPYSINGFSGVMPIKISFAEYSNAYNEFKKQPK